MTAGASMINNCDAIVCVHGQSSSMSVMANACCVCKVAVVCGNRRILNGPREIESNKRVVDFLKKHCGHPSPSLDSSGTFTFICRSCFSTVEKANKCLHSAQQAVDSLRQSIGLSPSHFELITQHPVPPPIITTPAAGQTEAKDVACTSAVSDPGNEPSNIGKKSLPRKRKSILDEYSTPPMKKARRRLLPQMSADHSQSPIVQVVLVH